MDSTEKGRRAGWLCVPAGFLVLCAVLGFAWPDRDERSLRRVLTLFVPLGWLAVQLLALHRVRGGRAPARAVLPTRWT